MAGQTLRPEQLPQHLARGLAALYVVAGDEALLVLETCDSLRHAAREAGYTERISQVLDARSDWSALSSQTGSISLFGDRRLLEWRLPSGKPGKTGGDTLARVAGQLPAQADDTIVVLQMPRLDRTLRNTAWFQAVSRHAVLIDVPTIDRTALPDWIGRRLAGQSQDVDAPTRQWIADRVEGNLLAAHQEILKLGLTFPAGRIAADDVQQAVMNVARYNPFQLRDAIQSGNAVRVVRMIEGLRAEGEALPLILWAISQTWARSPEQAPPAVIRHAHDIDRLIKGLHVPGRLDAWQELTNLALRLTRRA
ncbi:MAG: DNA polymerase III subunit delta [Pigmentiphaga sp.]